MSNSRSGRVIVYSNQVPYETDVLYSNLYKMVDVSNLAQAVLGGAGTSNATLISGLSCSPSSPLGLTVAMGNGVVYSLVTMDATAYSTIPSDTSDFLYKAFTQVSNFTQTGFTAPVSGTTNWLIEVAVNTDDIDPLSRPYFNPADPSNPIFQSAPQTRVDKLIFQIKPATSPSIPTPDPGFIGLYVVSVAAGQTTITSGNISVYSGAPFITESLTQKISQTTADARYVRPVQVQNSAFNYASTTGSANTYSITLSPAVTSLVAGLTIQANINIANTGASTLNVNDLGAIAIQVNTPLGMIALTGGELNANSIYDFIYNGTNFQLLNPSVSRLIWARVYFIISGSGQSLPGSNAETKLLFDTVDSDSFSMWNSTNHNFLIPKTGKYRLNSTILTTFSASVGTGFWLLPYINSTAPGYEIIGYNNFTTGTSSDSVNGTDILALTAGQTLDLRFHNASTLATSIDVVTSASGNFMTLEYIGN